jgi:hypothetical protein
MLQLSCFFRGLSLDRWRWLRGKLAYVRPSISFLQLLHRRRAAGTRLGLSSGRLFMLTVVELHRA